jgi:hypothetical protein
LKHLLFTITALLALLRLLLIISYHHSSFADWLFARNYAAWFHIFYNVNEMYFVFGLICICTVLARNYLVVRDTALRRRIKLVSYGSLAAIAPAVIFTLAEQVVHWWGMDGIIWHDAFPLMLSAH